MKKTVVFFAIAIMTLTAMAEFDRFAALDKNSDGKITSDEWIAAGKKGAKQKTTEFNEEKSLGYFQAKDTDGNGTLSQDELLNQKSK